MNHRSHRRKILYALLVLLVIVSVLTAYKAYKYFSPRPVEVTHYLAVVVSTEKLEEGTQKMVIMPKGGVYFYTLSPGSNLTRQLNISNIFNYEVALETAVVGNISQFLTIDIPQKILQPKTNEIINLTVSIPENALVGHYFGNLTIRLIP